MSENIADDVLFNTLARMTKADSNIQQVEVDTVQTVYKELTGNDVSSSDIRVAALGELHEETPFKTYLERCSGKLSIEAKQRVMIGLVKVMESNGELSSMEISFFNQVAKCFGLKASEILNISDD